MRKLFGIIVAGLFLLSVGMSSALFAAEAPKTGALKIGIVDMFRALNESSSGKKAKADLEALIKSKQAVIEEKGKGIEKLKMELEKQSAVISPEARKAKEEEMERLMRDYQRMVADSQAEVKKKEAELTGGILRDLRAAITAVAQEEGYSLVLEQAEGLVLFSKKELDITDRIIKKYNESKAKSSK